MSPSSPRSWESVIQSPCCKTARFRTIVAICSAVVGAAAASILAAGHSGGAAAPAAIAPLPAATVAASSQMSAVKDLALQSFKQDLSASAAKSFEAGLFIEHDAVSSETGTITQVNVRSRSGDVRIIHNPDPGVYVLAGKFAAATNTARAREFAQRLRYDVKRDGETVTAVIGQPSKFPPDVYSASAICVVVAPDNVKVAVFAGGQK